MTIYSYAELERKHQTLHRTVFSGAVSDLSSRFKSIVRQHEDLLLSLRNLRHTYGEITHKNFQVYTQSVSLAERYPALHVVGWHPRVVSDDVVHFENEVREQMSNIHNGYSDYKIFPDTGNNSRFPLLYSAHQRPDFTAPLGIDIGALPGRKAALSSATDSGRLSATATIDLVKLTETDQDPTGLIFIVAAYDSAGLTSVQERREHLRGAFAGVFRVERLVSEAGGNNFSGLEISDISNTYRLGDIEHAPSGPFYTTGDLNAEYDTLSAVIDVAGRVWKFRFYSSPESFSALYPSFASRITLALGTLASFLSALFIYVLLSSRHRAITLASSLTRDLRVMNDNLHRSNENLIQFAFVASHDLQTPVKNIQAVILMLEEALAEKDEISTKRFIGYISTSARRMESLVKDLLSYARTDQSEIKKCPTDLTELVHQVVSSLNEKVELCDATIDIDGLPNVVCDPSQIERVFLNLIDNALKYRHPQRAPHIKLTSSESPEGTVSISIKDNGLGIEQQHLSKVLEPFKRLHRHEDIEGTGLGLSICRGIAQAHGGNLTLESEHNLGSIVTLYLPGVDVGVGAERKAA